MLLNERIQKGRVLINTTITGKASREAFTSADSGVKGLKATNPLAVFALELVKPLVKGKVLLLILTVCIPEANREWRYSLLSVGL